MPTDNQIREAIVRLLDDGIHPVSIRVTLTDLLGGVMVPRWPSTVELIDRLVKETAESWLTSAEVRMGNYARDESWQRLGALLATYQKVTS